MNSNSTITTFWDDGYPSEVNNRYTRLADKTGTEPACLCFRGENMEQIGTNFQDIAKIRR